MDTLSGIILYLASHNKEILRFYETLRVSFDWFNELSILSMSRTLDMPDPNHDIYYSKLLIWLSGCNSLWFAGISAQISRSHVFNFLMLKVTQINTNCLFCDGSLYRSLSLKTRDGRWWTGVSMITTLSRMLWYPGQIYFCLCGGFWLVTRENIIIPLHLFPLLFKCVYNVDLL